MTHTHTYIVESNTILNSVCVPFFEQFSQKKLSAVLASLLLEDELDEHLCVIHFSVSCTRSLSSTILIHRRSSDYNASEDQIVLVNPDLIQS